MITNLGNVAWGSTRTFMLSSNSTFDGTPAQLGLAYWLRNGIYFFGMVG